MTRKDFELIARAVASCWRQPDIIGTGEDGILESELIGALADALATTNPRFDRQRFIKAATREDAYETPDGTDFRGPNHKDVG